MTVHKTGFWNWSKNSWGNEGMGDVHPPRSVFQFKNFRI